MWWGSAHLSPEHSKNRLRPTLPLQQPILRETQHVLTGEDAVLVVQALEVAAQVAQGAGHGGGEVGFLAVHELVAGCSLQPCFSRSSSFLAEAKVGLRPRACS